MHRGRLRRKEEWVLQVWEGLEMQEEAQGGGAMSP